VVEKFTRGENTASLITHHSTVIIMSTCVLPPTLLPPQCQLSHMCKKNNDVVQAELDELRMKFPSGTVVPFAVRELEETVRLEWAHQCSFEAQQKTASRAASSSAPGLVKTNLTIFNDEADFVALYGYTETVVVAVHGCNSESTASFVRSATGCNSIKGRVCAAAQEPLNLPKLATKVEAHAPWTIEKRVRRDSLTFEIVDEEDIEIALPFMDSAQNFGRLQHFKVCTTALSARAFLARFSFS